jgi:hypothetical protein
MRTENIFEEKIEVGHRKRKYLEKDFFCFLGKSATVFIQYSA